MTSTTSDAFASALAQGGTLVAAWDDMDVHDKTLLLFSVGAKGAKRLAATSVDPKDHEDKADELRARGVRMGQTYGSTVFVWAADDKVFTLWSATAVVIEANRATLRLAGGFTPPADAKRVVTFYDPDDRGHRGVTLALVSSSQIVAVEEHDDTPKNDPTYNQDNLVEDGMWASYVGRDLAVWIDVPHEDQIARVDNADDLRLSKQSRVFAAEIEAMPATGAFEHVLRPLGVIAPAGEVAFRFAPNPLTPDKRFLELRVSTPSGKSTNARWVRQGSNAEIAAYLRGIRTPTNLQKTMNSLLQGLKQDGYA